MDFFNQIFIIENNFHLTCLVHTSFSIICNYHPYYYWSKMRTPWFQKLIETSAMSSPDNSEEKLNLASGHNIFCLLKVHFTTKAVKIQLSLHSFPKALYKSFKPQVEVKGMCGYHETSCMSSCILCPWQPPSIHLPHLVTGASLMLVVLSLFSPASSDCSSLSLIEISPLSFPYSVTELPFDAIGPKTKMAGSVQWRN